MDKLATLDEVVAALAAASVALMWAGEALEDAGWYDAAEKAKRAEGLADMVLANCPKAPAVVERELEGA